VSQQTSRVPALTQTAGRCEMLTPVPLSIPCPHQLAVFRAKALRPELVLLLLLLQAPAPSRLIRLLRQPPYPVQALPQRQCSWGKAHPPPENAIRFSQPYRPTNRP